MTASSVCLDEHAAVNKVIVILDGLRGHLREGKDPDARDWPKVVEFLSVFVDRCHFGKEEQWLFPALREVADEETHQLIRRLLGDHESGRAHVASLAKAVESASGKSSRLWRGRAIDRTRAMEAIEGCVDVFRPHIATEEAILFPLADQVLAEETQETLRRGYDRIERDIVGPGRYEGFQVMLQELAERYGADQL